MTRERLDAPLLKAFDGLQEGVWLVDDRHRTILFSTAVAAALVGLDPAQLVGEPVLRFASTPQDQRDMDRVLLDAGTPGFAGAWLRHRGLDWAADLLPSSPAATSFLASQRLEVSP